MFYVLKFMTEPKMRGILCTVGVKVIDAWVPNSTFYSAVLKQCWTACRLDGRWGETVPMIRRYSQDVYANNTPMCQWV